MARPAALALAIAALAAIAPSAQAGWGAPFRFAAPGTLDTLPAQIAFSPAGAAAVTFAKQDADVPGSAEAFAASRSPGGKVGGPRRVPGAQEVLGLTFDGPTLELLSGTSPAGESCCSSVQARRLTSRGAFGRGRTLIGGLAGVTVAELVTLTDGQMLAAIATGAGVWVVQSVRADRFGHTRRLTGRRASPQSLAVTNLGGNRTVVAWTAAGGSAPVGPRSILAAVGSRLTPPRRGRTVLRVPSGHRIDDLGVEPGASTPTLAWIESWYDRRGGYHSQARIANLSARPQAHTVSAAGEIASGLGFAGDAAGDQAAVWNACARNGSCTLHAAVSRAGRQFARSQSLGSIDASQTPAVTVAPNGEVVVGWVRLGHPLGAEQAVGSARFGAPHVLSRTIYAYDLALSSGPHREAMAVWTQGSLAPSVVGDVLRF